MATFWDLHLLMYILRTFDDRFIH